MGEEKEEARLAVVVALDALEDLELEILDEKIMKYDTAGDPMTGVKWTRRTTEEIAEE